MSEARLLLLAACAWCHASGCTLAMESAAPPNSRPAIVAHRGASADAPENTLAAFRAGFDQGADAVEGDFRSTRDGVIVAIHDADLRRTTGDPRRVDEIDFAELQRLDAGSWGRWRDGDFVGERVPSLEAILEVVPEGRGVVIEVKDSTRIVPALIEAVDGSGVAVDMITVISFDADVIAAVKSRRPDWRALWVTGFTRENDRWSPDLSEMIETARRIRADGVDVQATLDVVDESFASSMREAGLELHVWTVDDPEVSRVMAELGVDSITTNRPATIRRAMTEHEGGG